MTEEKDRNYSKDLLGKTVVSKTGKKFGDVGDLIFEVSSGELIHLLLRAQTSYTDKMEPVCEHRPLIKIESRQIRNVSDSFKTRHYKV